MKTYYVTATDVMLSGIGQAKHLIYKIVFKCNSMEQSRIVSENATNHGLKYVKVAFEKPHFDKKIFFISERTQSVHPKWYVKNEYGKGVE